MSIKHIPPHPQLHGIVAKLWVFESRGKAPHEDMKLIVPNGMAKLIIPFRNGLTGSYKDWSHLSKESSITLIGISDSPAIVEVEQDAPSGNIGLEFTAIGAYRLFRLRHSELKNRIYPLEDVLGKTTVELQEMIANTEQVVDKIQVIQQYLIRLLFQSNPDPVLDHCLRQIENSKGLVTVAHLEKNTGYSSRWLYEKFIEKVGLSPKNLSSVTRFMHFYEQWAKNPHPCFFRQHLYDYFYDQAHFIKEFKRFTGFPPSKLLASANEFGRLFYRE